MLIITVNVIIEDARLYLIFYDGKYIRDIDFFPLYEYISIFI